MIRHAENAVDELGDQLSTRQERALRACIRIAKGRVAGRLELTPAGKLARQYGVPILEIRGGTLLELWRRTGITQREWSRRSGVSVRQIQRITLHGATPLATTAMRLLEALQ